MAIVVQQLLTVLSVCLQWFHVRIQLDQKMVGRKRRKPKNKEREREKSNKPNDFGSCLLVKHKKCAPLPQPINITINSPFERNKPLLCVYHILSGSFLIKFNVNTENMVMSGDTSKSKIIDSFSMLCALKYFSIVENNANSLSISSIQMISNSFATNSLFILHPLFCRLQNSIRNEFSELQYTFFSNNQFHVHWNACNNVALLGPNGDKRIATQVFRIQFCCGIYILCVCMNGTVRVHCEC